MAIPLKYHMTFSSAILFLILGCRRPSPWLSGGWKSIYTVGVHVEREMGWTARSNDTANCIVLGDQGSSGGELGGGTCHPSEAFVEVDSIKQELHTGSGDHPDARATPGPFKSSGWEMRVTWS